MNSAPIRAAPTAPTVARSTSRRLHVAIVDEELPYPPTSGKRIRTLNLILRMAGRHRLTYLCHRNADLEEARLAAEFFADHGIETIVVNRAVPPRSGMGFYARLAANLLSPLPYSVVAHDSPDLRGAIAEYAAGHSVDLWHCEWTPYADSLGGLPGARRLIMAHNVESQIWQRYGETETNPLKRWYIRRQWRKFQRFERRATAEADQTVAVSDTDAVVLRSEFGARRVAVVENGVDLAFFLPTAGPRQANRILFLGSLDWRPNLDAVAQLLDCVFPAVRAAEPKAQLEVVGRNPPASLRRRVAGMHDVELYGSVADVRPHLLRCGVMAVPLRIAGGSRLKILEALACGLPVVSTLVGAEGLHLEPGRHLTVVPGVTEMASAILRAVRAPEESQAMAYLGRQRVLERYGWDALADQLERIWIRCAEDHGGKD
jgi:glycosyltransferase involved in cell wall biosynthesis